MPSHDDATWDFSENESLTTEVLKQALNQVKERLSRITQEMVELQRAMAVAKEEEKLLDRLLKVRSGADIVQESPAQFRSKHDVIGSETQIYKVKSPVVNEAIKILEDAGRPLHISELMRILKEHSIPIPGAGAQANLIVHISREAQIVRPSRGMYALAAWGLGNEPKSAKRKTKRRRRGSKTP